jgi:histidyl-tRNA synthetase
MGKYGEEGDKLIFRILNNGLNDPKNIDKSRAAFENTLQGKNDRHLTERALRYDLTIPFARYVAMNQGTLVFPFKRYQVQPVWRADRPQKGRYREFYQCDGDVVGSKSLLNEVDFAFIYHSVFTELKIAGYELHINSRKILTALAEACGGIEKLNAITVAIDKLDKIGIEKVQAELREKQLSEEQISLIEKYLSISGSNEQKIEQLIQLLNKNEHASAGIDELKFILDKTATRHIPLVIDFTLARGLNYYTGIIFEVKAPAEVKIGSIGGGGRYDDLTGLFGVPGIPGVGISFGVDRIYDVMEELHLFPAELEISTSVLFFNEGSVSLDKIVDAAASLRTRGISCEIYPDADKEDRQFKYAKRKNIPYIIASNGDGQLKVKNINDGQSHIVRFEELADFRFQIKSLQLSFKPAHR